MSEKKVDRRVLRTRRMLRNGLAQLMREKRAQDITVRELAERCDITRGTFYIHYRNVFDMVDHIEDELIDEFRRVIVSFSPREMLDPSQQLLVQLFRLMRDNMDIVSVLVGPNGDLKFINRFKRMVKEQYLTALKEAECTGKERCFDFFASFVVSGFVGLFEVWFAHGMTETPEEVAGLAWKVVMPCARALLAGEGALMPSRGAGG